MARVKSSVEQAQAAKLVESHVVHAVYSLLQVAHVVVHVHDVLIRGHHILHAGVNKAVASVVVVEDASSLALFVRLLRPDV